MGGYQKFRDLLPVLKSKRFSLHKKGEFYGSCVRSVLLHGCETWAVREEDILRIEKVDMQMIRMICGVSLKDKQYSSHLREKLGLRDIREVMRKSRLRWYGHVERCGEDNWVSRCRTHVVQGESVGGRKTWDGVMNGDFKARGIDPKSAPWLAGARDTWRCICSGTIQPVAKRLILRTNPRPRRTRR